jgi:hypothetical protein
VGAFTDSVDPSAFTILNQPDYIFLCGGPLKDFDHSLRAHFYRDKVENDPVLLKKVQLAEKADEWYQSRKLFDDLLELEEHLAGLAACILLFVESPGAIAEFGAFSQMKLLQGKLIVVIEDSYFTKQSFIRNGLVEHARRIRSDSVFSYPWLLPPSAGGPSKVDPAGAADTLNEIEAEIKIILAKRPKTIAFDKNDHGHMMLLVADLVSLNVIVQQSEIHGLLTALKIEVPTQALKKYLFLLDQLALVATFRYGNVDYYLSLAGAPAFATYAPKTPADRSRLRTLLRKELPLTPNKAKALEAFKRRAAGVTP